MSSSPPAKRVKLNEDKTPAVEAEAAEAAPLGEQISEPDEAAENESQPEEPPPPQIEMDTFKLNNCANMKRFFLDANGSFAQMRETNPMNVEGFDPKFSKLELEARFGSYQLRSSGFRTGIRPKALFDSFKNSCARRFRPLHEGRKITTIDASRSTDMSDVQGKVRIKYDERGWPLQCEMKRRLETSDRNIHIYWKSSHRFASRISAALEQPLPDSAMDQLISGSNQVTLRHKIRRSYAPKRIWNFAPTTAANCFEAASAFGEDHPLKDFVRIDVTEVRQKIFDTSAAFSIVTPEKRREQQELQPGVRLAETRFKVSYDAREALAKLIPSYEIEIELVQQKITDSGFGPVVCVIPYFSCCVDSLNSVLPCVSRSNEEKLAYFCEHFYEILDEIQEMIQDAKMDPNFCDAFVQRVYDPRATQLLKTRLNAACGRPKTNTSFPGCMPVGLSRPLFQLIRDYDYLVSEKTDGVRHLMIVIKELHSSSGGTIYLVNRSFQFFRVRTDVNVMRNIIAAVCPHGDAVLDGELIRHAESLHPMYLIYDALRFDGMDIQASPYSQRLEFADRFCNSLKQVINSPFKETFPISWFPFWISKKRVVPKSQVREVFAHIRSVRLPGENREVRIYTDKELHQRHRNDGLIFCPNTKYMPDAPLRVIKWKYADMQTADFAVEFPGRYCVVDLFCVGAQSHVTQGLPEDEFRQLEDDIREAQLPPNQPIIAEFAYSQARVWSYRHLRTDKPKPNHTRVVEDTRQAATNPINEPELLYCVLAPPEIPLPGPQHQVQKIDFKRLLQELDARMRSHGHGEAESH